MNLPGADANARSWRRADAWDEVVSRREMTRLAPRIGQAASNGGFIASPAPDDESIMCGRVAADIASRSEPGRRASRIGVLAQGGVDTGVKSGMAGDPLQQCRDGGLVGGVEAGEKFGVVRVCGAIGLVEQFPGLGREVQRVGAPVLGVSSSLDQSAGFEVVDQPDHDVAVDAQGVGELLLGLTGGCGQVDEEPVVLVLQPQRCQPLGEPGGGVVADLGQQETRTLIQRFRRRATRRLGLGYVHNLTLATCQGL